jgi:hypothetical protein
MKKACLSLFVLAHNVFAHGDHGTGMKPGENIQAYAQRHVCLSNLLFFQLYINFVSRWPRSTICTPPSPQFAGNTQFSRHRDSFDLRSFFQLHDLNRYVSVDSPQTTSPTCPRRDGYWDREEVEAIYGVHHVYSQKKSKAGRL